MANNKKFIYEYFIHDDGRYMLSIIDLDCDIEIWCGEIPKIQFILATNGRIV